MDRTRARYLFACLVVCAILAAFDVITGGDFVRVAIEAVRQQ